LSYRALVCAKLDDAKDSNIIKETNDTRNDLLNFSLKKTCNYYNSNPVKYNLSELIIKVKF